MDKYVEILKGDNIKVTSPRLEIMNYLDRNRTHPSADRIYSDLKKKNPSLSRTTVYNTLDMLKAQNVIQVLTITESEHRYDFKKEMHHHFLCTECDNIIDIDIACPNLKKLINGEHMVKEVHGYLKGTCKDCLAKDRKKR